MMPAVGPSLLNNPYNMDQPTFNCSAIKRHSLSMGTVAPVRCVAALQPALMAPDKRAIDPIVGCLTVRELHQRHSLTGSICSFYT